MNNKKKIYCVIPAWNEEENIGAVIEALRGKVDEMVVVDDGSKDKTSEIASRAGAVVLRHVINRGQGAGLQTGNEYCLRKEADIVVHFDADNQFDANEIADMVQPIIDDEADIVFGSRFLGKKSNLPWAKENVLFPIARIINKLLIGFSLSDPQNGFRAMSLKALKAINILNDGMAHNSEIQYRAYKNKLRIKEVPITVKYNRFGQNLLGGRGAGAGGIRIVKDLLIAKFFD